MKTTRAIAAIALALSLIQVPANAVPADIGLYGSQDPTYDGVFRQSLSILALKSVEATVPAAALKWLAAQQCADGSFQSYRAPSTDCKDFDLNSFTGKDTNSTAIAILALQAAGKPAAAKSALKWLRGSQNTDGGFGFSRGAGSDSMSTALAVMALRAMSIDPTTASKSGHTPIAYLRSNVVGCDAAAGQRGGLAFKGPEPTRADDMTSGQALAALAVWPVVKSGDLGGATKFSCPAGVGKGVEGIRTAVAGYLAARLGANHYSIPSAWGSGSDWSTTSWTVLGLVGAGSGKRAVQGAIAAMKSNLKEVIVGSSGKVEPGRLSLAILVAAATGQDAASFGGRDLVKLLRGTIR